MYIFRFTSSTPISHLVIGLVLLASMLCVTKPARAENDQLKKLMLANNCLACHQIDKRKYGPNFHEIANKYGNSNAMIAMLAVKIKAGGQGVWGEDMMPPQPQLSDADALILAKYILLLK